MSRKHVVSLAALVAAGAAMLGACGTPEAAQPQAAPATVNAADSTPLNLLQGTAKSNNATMGTGDWAPPGAPASIAQKWVQLSAGVAGNLDPVVTNGAHKVLYVFDKDTKDTSNCTGTCKDTWPPVEINPHGGKVFVAGVDPRAVGFVKRADDGNFQLTLNHHPIYTFSKDVKPFDTNGEAVQNIWWAVEPDGSRNFGGHTPPGSTPPATGTAAPPTGAPTAALTARSAILFDDKDFADSGASQGVAGPGCQPVARPGVTSSITTDGTLKLWTGDNCTGKSVVINGDVRDLASIGFDNAIRSVRFGDGGGTTTPPTTTTKNNSNLTATSAILDSGKNLQEPDGSQAVAGHGCQNVGNPSGVSSIQADGTYKLWTGPNCTGKSMIVTGNQLDLSAIGFDKMVASIRFAD
jgi:predicted lipoprotein with Yx(FWY)xxD motif